MKKTFLLCACLVVMAFTLTACGEKNNPETTGTTTGSSTEDSSSTENGNNSNGTGSVGKDLGNMIDDAGDVVDDAAKDVSDALTGNYDTYDHAYKYFMDQNLYRLNYSRFLWNCCPLYCSRLLYRLFQGYFSRRMRSG